MANPLSLVISYHRYTDTILGLSLQNSNIFRNYNACHLQGRQPQTYSCRSCSFICDLSPIPWHSSTPKLSEKIQNSLYSSCAPVSWKERFGSSVISPDTRVSQNYDKLSVTSHMSLCPYCREPVLSTDAVVIPGYPVMTNSISIITKAWLFCHTSIKVDFNLTFTIETASLNNIFALTIEIL